MHVSSPRATAKATDAGVVAASPVRRRRLTRQDWSETALRMLADGGVGAVAVEPIASALGTTKGSFYHHFSSRDELLVAALALWEHQHTVEVNAGVDAATADPREQLRLLVRRAIGMAEQDPIGLTLLATADHPLVAPVLARVTAARVDYLTAIFGRLGERRTSARRRALLAYSAYLGHSQLAHSTPGVLPHGTAARHAYLDLVIDALAGPRG